MTRRPQGSMTGFQINRRGSLRGLAALAVAGLATAAGCDPRQALFFLQPFDQKTPAECPSLKGRRVVILTSASAAVAGEVGIERELARGLAETLRKEIRKVDIVDTGQVAAWSQARSTWTDPTDAARAFDAEVVVFLEITRFQVEDASSPGLFQGQSDVGIRVLELAYPKDDKGKPITTREKESNILYEGNRATVFPSTGGVPIEAGVNRATFRSKFVKLVVSEISWTFFGRATGDQIQDTNMD